MTPNYGHVLLDRSRHNAETVDLALNVSAWVAINTDTDRLLYLADDLTPTTQRNRKDTP